MDELREELAALAHQQWSSWMWYLFGKCRRVSQYEGEGLYIPAEYVERWNRQMDTPYADLPEQEKESDRKEADRVIEVLRRRGHLE